ncbi:MAG TPA: CHASE4 domain-containing protein, partial [Allocoleopsis sp.]
MRLRTKTLLVISMTLAGLVGVLYLVTSNLLSGSIKQAEKENTLQTVTGLLNVFNQTQDDFSSRFNDWSAWDDTYNFIQNGNQNYIKSNLSPAHLAALKVNLILYINPQGKLVFGSGFDIQNKKNTPIPELIKNKLNLKESLLKHSNSEDKLTGIISLPQGLMRITAHPILPSSGTGKIQGTIIFGRYLDQDSIHKLEKITNSSIQIYSINKNLEPELKNILPDLINQKKNQSPPIIINITDENTITGYTSIKDIYNRPAMLLKINLSRDIYDQGEKQSKILIITVIIVGSMFGVLTLVLIEKLILFRLGVLGDTVKDIGITGDLSKRVIIPGKDELSKLGNNVNNMLDSLAEAQYQLKQTEAKYRLIFENSTYGIFQTTPQGSYISANIALARIYGYDNPDELINQISDITTQLYVNPHRRQELIKLMKNQEIVNHFESQIYRKDRSVIWIAENVRCVRDNTGEILYYEGTVQDVTHRKIMEEALKFEQEQSERLLLNILPEPIADRLKMEEEHIADHFGEVTVLFADIVGFTEMSNSISPGE